MENKKLKILFIIPQMALAGAEVLLVNLCSQLYSLGHQLKVISLHEPHESFNKLPQKECFLRHTKFQVVKFKTTISLLNSGIKVVSDEYKQAVLDFKPDVIHSHLFLSEIVAHSFHYKNCVYFSHAHDNMYQLEPLLYKTKHKRTKTDYIERFWLLKMYKKFNGSYVSISKDTNDFLERSLPKSQRKNISMLHNAINTKLYNKSVKTIDASVLKLVSVGNLVPKKNHTFLIEVAKILREKNVNFTIDILGFGNLFESLTNKVIAADLQQNVFFRGSVGNVPEYLANSNIYLHPATYEPFGLVLLEAMASGLPVVCLNGDGNKDIIVEGKNGFMIDPPNAEKFVEKILLLKKNSEKYSELSAYARIFADGYDIENYANKLLKIYHNKLAENI